MIDEMATLGNGKFNKVNSNANQSKKRHSYVTKKSTLNRNTGNIQSICFSRYYIKLIFLYFLGIDRYISLLGKPPSAKAD